MLKDLGLLIMRIALVAVFPISGYFKIINWPGIATLMGRNGWPMPEVVGMIGIAIEFICPAMIILGIGTRFAALGLIVYTVIATWIGHKFWMMNPPEFFPNLMSFMKNIGIIGGMVLLMAVGPGRIAVQRSSEV